MAIYELSYVNNQQERVTKSFGTEKERTAYMEENFLDITHAHLREYASSGVASGLTLEEALLGDSGGDYLDARRLDGEEKKYAASSKPKVARVLNNPAIVFSGKVGRFNTDGFLNVVRKLFTSLNASVAKGIDLKLTVPHGGIYKCSTVWSLGVSDVGKVEKALAGYLGVSGVSFTKNFDTGGVVECLTTDGDVVEVVGLFSKDRVLFGVRVSDKVRVLHRDFITADSAYSYAKSKNLNQWLGRTVQEWGELRETTLAAYREELALRGVVKG